MLGVLLSTQYTKLRQFRELAKYLKKVLDRESTSCTFIFL